MIEIANDLFLGDHISAQEMGLREANGIKAIVSILNDQCLVDDNGIMRLRISAPDGPGFEMWHVGVAVQFVEEMHGVRGLPTLVHCWAGASRSVCVVAAYLHLHPEAFANAGVFEHLDAGARYLRKLKGMGESLPQEAVWNACCEYVAFRKCHVECA